MFLTLIWFSGVFLISLWSEVFFSVKQMKVWKKKFYSLVALLRIWKLFTSIKRTNQCLQTPVFTGVITLLCPTCSRKRITFICCWYLHGRVACVWPKGRLGLCTLPPDGSLPVCACGVRAAPRIPFSSECAGREEKGGASPAGTLLWNRGSGISKKHQQQVHIQTFKRQQRTSHRGPRC